MGSGNSPVPTMSEGMWGAWISIPKEDNEMHLPLTNEVMSKGGVVDNWDFYHHPALKMITHLLCN